MQDLILIWRSLARNTASCWVLFEHGTCVFFDEAMEDPVQEAISRLQASAGEGPDTLWEHALGYLLAGSLPCVATFVELHQADPGQVGRWRREQDIRDQKVIHVEKVATKNDRESGKLRNALRAAQLILNQAVKDRVSQVEFEPLGLKGRVSFQTGENFHQVATPPQEFFPVTAAHLRQLAGIGPDQSRGRVEVRIPQGPAGTYELYLWETETGEAYRLTSIPLVAS